jgi:hypothetical protein
MKAFQAMTFDGNEISETFINAETMEAAALAEPAAIVLLDVQAEAEALERALVIFAQIEAAMR